MFQALLAQLEGLARQTPVSMWGGRALVRSDDDGAVRSDRGAAAALAGSSRRHPPSGASAALDALSACHALDAQSSGPKSHDGAHRQHRRGRSLPASVLDAILTRTEGVPLFAEELTKAILESGLLRETADGLELTWRMAQPAIPNTLQDSLDGPPR